MSKLQATAILKIHEGKLDEFTVLATQCIASVKEKDKCTLQYDWFFNESHTECVVREAYTDSNALLTHMANLGELLGKVLKVADMSLELYGDPSPELKTVINSANGKIYSFYGGI